MEEANRKFKEISEAYEILTDTRKRMVYDQYGTKGARKNNRPRSEDVFDFNGFNVFTFRDPDAVFREFFGGGIFDFFNDLAPMTRSRRSRPGSSRHESFFSALNGDNMADVFSSGNSGEYASLTTMESSFSGGGVPTTYMKRTSTSTKVQNGKKVTTKKMYENGRETVKVYENDVLQSVTVNGVPQSIKYK
ncbi:hypothetical protein NQ317_015187 [Molorchus minor]|uniref:J domain-containing protein n=1 Tax=Molorchus minor TaxID=1323400 RepID=A0ABQ9K827_9CUCU|nr:hypothetical protein NQ317_015187 [Molorchus minor]